jgi:hypothetical protein
LKKFQGLMPDLKMRKLECGGLFPSSTSISTFQKGKREILIMKKN